ncbi:hypothetical protein BFC19_07410 [Brochothrix thermosphacta]|uniref:hypothetical protein n=1 Tax=Brochothrix thermosphacta TaxID=2756 RepID=UPI000E7470AE|nr:hypothetical protein [Brochothrix thermosphacta]ANZ95216.1 hypothetical protein BFC19_07410 [Brochothrix thermosphacta]
MRKVTKLIILVLSVMMVGLVIPANSISANSESVRFDNLNLSLSVKYNETEDVLYRDDEYLLESGMSHTTVDLISSSFNRFSEKKKIDLLRAAGYKNVRVITLLVVWGARTLAGAGLGWLGEKLLNSGSKKFCKTYKRQNKVTRSVCNLLGY